MLDEIKNRLQLGKYDFVLTLFPSPDTHGAHKAATLTALSAISQMQGEKPVVLSCQDSLPNATAPLDWTGFKSPQHPFTVAPQRYTVDLATKFGFNNAMDYRIVLDWVIAAQKSQGLFQMSAGQAGKEEFTILDTATPSAAEKADQLFRALSQTAAHPVPLPSASSP